MNGLNGRKAQNMESPVPGCLGRMVNLFDLGAASRGNKLLTDKPHHYTSSLSRSRSDVAPRPSFEDELIMSNSRGGASNGTPVKKLIAQEMLKEVEQKMSPANVVAKLMGLDSLPQLQLDHSVSSDHEAERCQENSRDLKDVYEMWQSHQKANRSLDDEIMAEKQMDLVRKKFLQESNSFFPQHPSTKRITVLRPSKDLDTDSRNKQIKKPASSVHGTGQPTRIVVLKPSPGKGLDIKAVASSSPSSPRGYFDEPGGDAESREAAREITRQMRENLRGPFSSVLSNGYIGDGSLFDKSDSEVGNLDDFEVMSPVSRHSWDCPNRVGSCPFSSSSLSRASFSPESSVCREAKKRLSERWALMGLNGSCSHQQKYIPRASSTLGDMLSLADTKGPAEENNEARASTSCICSGLSPEESSNDSLKSTPPPVEVAETRSLKSSWKVSNFLFFGNKKGSNRKTDASQSSNEPSSITPLPGRTCENCLPPKDCCLPTDSSRFWNEPSSSKLRMAGNAGENLDQPSPISVLQPPFEEESIGIPDCSGPSMSGFRGPEMSLKSNLIDKSPPIGSIARTLSWDDDLSIDITRPETVIQEDEDWYSFVETLLTAAGLSGSVSSDPFRVRWHSPQSPLDPSLRDKYTDQDDKDPIHEWKRRQKRSNRKLIFDRLNAIIAEATTTCPRTNLKLDLVDHAWSQLKGWLSGSEGETVQANSVAAERVVRDEVMGRTWVDGLRLEMDDLGLEIEGKLLQELVQETVIDLTR